jgi:hypothetical protein
MSRAICNANSRNIQMISKALLVSAAAVGLLLAQPQTASAGVDIDVGVGYPYSPAYPAQYDPDYQTYPSYHNGGYDEDDDYDRISCWQGRRIVRSAGFRNVQTLRCYGDIYRYRAWRRGQQWRVSVDSDTGRIIRARPIYY